MLRRRKNSVLVKVLPASLLLFLFSIQPVWAEIQLRDKFLVGSKPTPFNTLGALVSHLYTVMIIFGGVLFLFLMILGGMTYIMGAGRGNSDQVDKGRKALVGSLIGFLLMFSLYWIVKIIEVLTGLDILSSSL